jgi:tetratricopeptide (TPR) repeat protein
MTNKSKKKKKSADLDARGKGTRGLDSGDGSLVDNAVHANDGDREKPAKGQRKRVLFLLLIVVAAVPGGLFFIDYWQRLPVLEAQQKIRDRDFGFAMTVLNEYLQDYPNDLVAMSLKARAHAGLEEFEKCKDIYERVEGVFQFEDQFAFAKSLTMLSFYNEAYSNWIGVMAYISRGELDSFSKTEKNQKLGEALYLMTVCQSQLGEVDRAVQTANDLMGVEGFEMQARYLLGLVQAKRGNGLEAIEQWDYCLEIDPDLTSLKIPPHFFLYELGVLKYEQGDIESSIAMMEKSLTKNYFVNGRPMDPKTAGQSIEAIGVAYDDLGDLEKSKLFWTRLLEFESQTGLRPSLIAREGLANVALLESRPQDAIELLVQLRAAGIEEKSSTTYLMQRALAMQGKEKEALQFGERTKELRNRELRINTIRSALQSKTGSYWAAVLRAYDFAKDGNWGQASQLLQPVIENMNDDFSRRLLKAVREKSELPPLTDVPVDIF